MKLVILLLLIVFSACSHAPLGSKSKMERLPASGKTLISDQLSFSGRVMLSKESEAKPVPGVVVYVTSYHPDPVLGFLVHSAVTDGQGYYQVNGLPPNWNYQLEVQWAGSGDLLSQNFIRLKEDQYSVILEDIVLPSDISRKGILKEKVFEKAKIRKQDLLK